ncbi:MAG: diphthamide biosynthesis enzyme Dph2 [Methanomassiliicoccales archaeon]|nr:MAG: diphthamide biosynthesis enzyme Dph2 [Methanomassiliicoccales archaeon]
MITDWEIQGILDEIKRRECKTVVLQLPEGLKREAVRVAKELEEKGDVQVVVSADPCYGACDLVDFKGDLLVHFGHAPMPYLPDEDILFVELSSNLDIFPLLEKALTKLKKNVAITAAIQYVPAISPAKQFLEKNGIKVHIGEGDSRIAYPGQVLGCNFSAPRAVAKNVEQILHIGEGNFHPLGIAMATGKDVLIVDPEKNEIRDVGELKESILRQRHAIISELEGASTFGILISSKIGQNRFGLAAKVKDLVEKKGKKAVMFLLDNLSPEYLVGYDVDAFVSVACPRIAIDDFAVYKKPVITPTEAEIVLGARKWEDYAFDEIPGSGSQA